MIDRSLMVTVLTVLKEQRDLKPGTAETDLFSEINLRASCAVDTPLLREHLQLGEQKGWIDKSRGALGEPRYRLSVSGLGGLTDLLHGG